MQLPDIENCFSLFEAVADTKPKLSFPNNTTWKWLPWYNIGNREDSPEGY